MEERVKCCEVIKVRNPPSGYSSNPLYSAPCSRWAVVTTDGKGYCWQHDPDRIKAKQPAGVTYRGANHPTIKVHDDAALKDIDLGPGAISLRENRTLSRDIAIKLIEAVDDMASWYGGTQKSRDIVAAAKHELGI